MVVVEAVAVTVKTILRAAKEVNSVEEATEVAAEAAITKTRPDLRPLPLPEGTTTRFKQLLQTTEQSAMLLYKKNKLNSEFPLVFKEEASKLWARLGNCRFEFTQFANSESYSTTMYMHLSIQK